MQVGGRRQQLMSVNWTPNQRINLFQQTAVIISVTGQTQCSDPTRLLLGEQRDILEKHFNGMLERGRSAVSLQSEG